VEKAQAASSHQNFEKRNAISKVVRARERLNVRKAECLKDSLQTSHMSDVKQE
jgi:hypothetical protein